MHLVKCRMKAWLKREIKISTTPVASCSVKPFAKCDTPWHSRPVSRHRNLLELLGHLSHSPVSTPPCSGHRACNHCWSPKDEVWPTHVFSWSHKNTDAKAGADTSLWVLSWQLRQRHCSAMIIYSLACVFIHFFTRTVVLEKKILQSSPLQL